jgi:hypothetical protein
MVGSIFPSTRSAANDRCWCVAECANTDSSTCCLASSDDIDAELEKLAVDAWRSLEWICDAQFPDELACFQWYRQPATMASRLPAAVQPETRAMPANNSVGFHDRRRVANLWKQPIETSKYQAVEDAKRESLRRSPPQNVYLLPHVQISALSAARGRNRSTTVQPMSLKRSLITRQHRPILGQPPAR